jgi:hypothetical protein
MKESDKSKIHINSNFILSICLLIMLDNLLDEAIILIWFSLKRLTRDDAGIAHRPNSLKKRKQRSTYL